MIVRVEKGLNKAVVYSREKRELCFIEISDALAFDNRVELEPVLPGMLAFPWKIFISITKKCNLHCPMCFSSSNFQEEKELSFDILKKIRDEGRNNGVFEVRFTGGEPTMHSRFFDIVELFHSGGINTSINTNGVYDKETILKLIDSPICDVRLSLDGPNAEVNDFIRGKSSFAISTKSIEALRRAQKRVRINCMVYRKNCHLIDDMVRLAENLDVPIRFCPMRRIGRAKSWNLTDELAISYEEWKELEKKIEKITSKVNVVSHSNENVENCNFCNGKSSCMDKACCSFKLSQLGIDQDGDVYSGGCIDDISKTLSIGSIKNSSLLDLWKSSLIFLKNRWRTRFRTCKQCISYEELWSIWSKELLSKFKQSRHLF